MKKRIGLIRGLGLFALVSLLFAGCELIDDSFNINDDSDRSNDTVTFVYTNSAGDVETNEYIYNGGE